VVVRNELDYKLLLGFPMPSALPEHVRAVPFKGEIIGTPTTMIVLIEGCRSNNAEVIEQRRIDFVNALGRGMLPHLRAAGGAQWPRSSWP
jgi:hypothetical protein